MNFDITIARGESGDTYGYMFDWGEEGSAPASIESNPPDVSVSTSSGLTQAGGPFTARDAAPPYPIEVNNWQDGAGQESYDTVDASSEAFRVSRSVNVTQSGHFELGPRVISFDDTWMKNRVLAALGTFWAGFVVDDTDPRNQLRFLHRYTLTAGSSVGWRLEDPANTGLTVLDATDIPDLSISETLDAPIKQATAACTMGDYLYCPVHNEVVLVTNVSTNTLTVARGQCGTTAAYHTSGETWYGFNWTPVAFANTDPTQILSALATDGKYVYAAFHSGSGSDGTVWRGVASDTAWDAGASDYWSAANNITALAYCGGYMYGAQDNLSGVTSAGYFTSADPAVYTPITLTGALTPGVSTAGLTGCGNFVYWAVTDGISRSWVYRIQHSSSDTFELVTEMPTGFVATCLYQHLGSLYIGGYIDSLYTTAASSNLPQYEGALYRVNVDGSSERIVRLRLPATDEPVDTRIKGIASSGPYLYLLANEDVYLYDTQHDGWHHYADTETATSSGATADIDWTAQGFVYLGDGIPAEGEDDPFVYDDNILTERTGWELGSTGYMDPAEVVVTQSSSSGYDYSMYGHVVNAGKYHRWTVSDLPTTVATLEVSFNNLSSQAGCIVIGGTDKEVRVQLQGVNVGGVVKYYKVYLGYTTNPTSKTVSNYSYRSTGQLSAETHTARILFSSSGARVYIDGTLSLSADYAELMDSIYPNTVAWSVGWPGNAQSDNNKEFIHFTGGSGLRFTAAGAYPPDYTGGTLVTTSMKDIAAMQGVAIVPVPGDGTSSGAGTYGGWDCILQNEVAPSGWLETSDSAFHMGSTDKFFTSVVVEHSDLKTGQTLAVTPYIDDATQSSVSGTQATTSTTAIVNTKGKRIRVRVNLTDDDPNRPYEFRLRVYRITARFFTENSPNVHTYYLNCREGVQTRSGRPWGTDPENAIRHLFSAAASGETVYIRSLFTTNNDNDRQLARIEQVKLYQGPGDQKRYDALEGTCMIKLRAVDE